MVVQKRQAETYLQRAREIIKADYSVERSDFLSTRLALLDKIIQASIDSKQHSNVVGALRPYTLVPNNFAVLMLFAFFGLQHGVTAEGIEFFEI